MRIILQQTIILSILILFLCSAALSAAIPAFPGAQGSAAYASGGRGGTVYKVTNLNNSGAGSLRDAVSQSNRIIVFEVSGWIVLTSNIDSYANNITIAGQTSPGGIGVRGGSRNGAGLRIIGNNWIVTHMRFASGIFGADAFVVYGSDPGQWYGNAGDNIMIDHCSIRYGCDECVDITYNPGRVTFSHCIIGPGVGDASYGSPDNCHDKGAHNYGFLIWDDGSYSNGGRTDLAIHNSYFPHNSFRNPELQHSANDIPTYDIVNNVIWDYAAMWSIEVTGEARVNVESNWVAGGNGGIGSQNREVIHYYGQSAENQFYVVDNWGAYRLPTDSPIKDDWQSIVAQGQQTTLSTNYKASSRWPTVGISVTRTDMDYNHALEVTQNAGATKPVRDSVDSTLISDFKNGRKGYVGYTEMLWPTLSNISPPTDRDNDGMADSWETSQFGDLAQTATGDYDSDGYDNIEEYLHYLAGASGPPPSLPPSPPPSPNLPPSAPENLRILG